MDEKKTLLVIAPPDVETGFKLGGADAALAFNADTLNEALARAVADGHTGIIAVPEEMRGWISEKNAKTLSRSLFPLVVYYPFPARWEEPYEIEEEVGVMIERAVGYRLRIRL